MKLYKRFLVFGVLAMFSSFSVFGDELEKLISQRALGLLQAQRIKQTPDLVNILDRLSHVLAKNKEGLGISPIDIENYNIQIALLVFVLVGFQNPLSKRKNANFLKDLLNLSQDTSPIFMAEVQRRLIDPQSYHRLVRSVHEEGPRLAEVTAYEKVFRYAAKSIFGTILFSLGTFEVFAMAQYHPSEIPTMYLYSVEFFIQLLANMSIWIGARNTKRLFFPKPAAEKILQAIAPSAPVTSLACQTLLAQP